MSPRCYTEGGKRIARLGCQAEAVVWIGVRRAVDSGGSVRTPEVMNEVAGAQNRHCERPGNYKTPSCCCASGQVAVEM